MGLFVAAPGGARRLIPGAVLLALAAMPVRAHAARAAAVAAEYSVEVGEGARELRVEASFAQAPAGGLVFDDGMGRYAREVEVARGTSWAPASIQDDVPALPACRRPCRLRYRFHLDEAARASRNRMAAFEQRGALVAPPSTWLVRPARRGPGRFALRVTTPPGISFATGLFPSGRDLYEANLADLPEAPYSAFGPFETTRVPVTGGEVEVAVLPGDPALDRVAVVGWAQRAGGDVAAYYGRMPVPRVLVIVVPGGRRAVGYGTTMGNGGASILIWVGAGAREEDLRRDWVLTHEMVHLGLPNLPRGQSWMEEGLATYVEPIARARHGHVGMEEVWTDLVRRTPQGAPGAGGLDANRGFGAIYWGGALFWLLADVEIRERTDSRRSLEDALRAVGDAGGSIAVTWPVERVLDTADRALGVKVLGPLYARMARSGERVDLQALWARLGIEDAGGIRFRDDAPLAAIRKAITAPTRGSIPAGGR
jgi:predicted metalloprotease with PDZ domain